MKRLAVIAVTGFISFSAWSMTLDPINQRINGDKPTSPIKVSAQTPADEVNEFDPSAPDAMETLAAFDQAYRAATGEDTQSESLQNPYADLMQNVGGCYRGGCHVFANVVKNERPQRLYLYIDGQLATTWLVSTARAPRVTPDFNGHPSGPFYPGAYTSRKYPGGDYRGLGNMPYASFYHGGFAIHGTPSIGQLGRPASHGCVRSHPENARYFSQLIRATGAANVFITVSGNRVSPMPTAIMSSN
jgi:hypothetical protein